MWWSACWVKWSVGWLVFWSVCSGGSGGGGRGEVLGGQPAAAAVRTQFQGLLLLKAAQQDSQAWRGVLRLHAQVGHLLGCNHTPTAAAVTTLPLLFLPSCRCCVPCCWCPGQGEGAAAGQALWPRHLLAHHLQQHRHHCGGGHSTGQLPGRQTDTRQADRRTGTQPGRQSVLQ